MCQAPNLKCDGRLARVCRPSNLCVQVFLLAVSAPLPGLRRVLITALTENATQVIALHAGVRVPGYLSTTTHSANTAM